MTTSTSVMNQIFESCGKSLRGFNAAVQPRKGKTGRCFAFSRAGRLLIKKEPTFLGDERIATETPVEDPILINTQLGREPREPSALNEGRAGPPFHQTTCIKLRELMARGNF